MIRSLVIAIVLVATPALAQTVQPPTIPLSAFVTVNQQSNITPPSPAWGTDYGVYNGILTNLNNFPVNTIYTSGNVGSTPTVAALTGALLVPPGDLSTFQTDGVAGYIANESGNPGVALFGGAVSLNNSYRAASWGINTLATNSYALSSPTHTGFDFIILYGGEFDVTAVKKSDGTTPTGTIRGISVFSGAEIKPLGGAYGIEIGPYELTGTEGWNAAIVIDGAPNDIGISIGAAARSGNNLGSQSIAFNTVNASGTNLQASTFADPNGDLVSSVPASAAIIFQAANVNEMLIQSGLIFQYSPNGSFSTTYATDDSGNTVIRSGAVSGVVSLQNSAATVLAEIGNPTPGTATKTVVADASGNWFSQAGFTGSKTAGSCALTLVAGVITNITGC